MDALQGVFVTTHRDEHDRGATNLVKHSRSLYSFLASIEANVHQTDVRVFAHSQRTGCFVARRQAAHLEPQSRHGMLEVQSDDELIFDDECATAQRRTTGHVYRPFPAIRSRTTELSFCLACSPRRRRDP